MNILFTCSARKWGGNEAWVLNAAKVLEKKHKVILAYRKPEIGDRFSIEKHQLPFRHEGDFQTLGNLVTLIRKNQIDIVVPTKRKDYVLAGLACKLTDAKNILILGIVRDLNNTLINNIVYNHLADGIMVNAHMIKDVLLHSPFMHSEKIAVVPNSIDIDTTVLKPAKKPYPFLITALGELSERKGFDFLIRGFALFIKQQNITDTGLTIIGSGGQQENLASLAEAKGIGNMVTLTGFQKNPYPYLLSSDVFTLTSKNEGLPYATLEAALLNNAIITTKAGGVEELLKNREHCLYVEYGNEQQLADAINELYTNSSLRHQLAANARTVTKEKFSLERMEQEMIGFFRYIKNKRP